MEWRAAPAVSKGVWERAFNAFRDGDVIPGILWMPEQPSGPVPLVLIGHGGKSHKRNPADLSIARRFVRRHAVAACAIDAISHGDRGPIIDTGDGPAQPEYLDLWKTPDTFDRMNADWSATLDALLGSGRFREDSIGYWGLSMGTVLGLPFVASDRRIAAAVLGACGLTQRGRSLGLVAERLRADAPSLTCPVHFILQWDDEIFDRAGALELFGLVGSADKRLHAHPGRHGAVPLEAVDAGRLFLADRLAFVRPVGASAQPST